MRMWTGSLLEFSCCYDAYYYLFCCWVQKKEKKTVAPNKRRRAEHLFEGWCSDARKKLHESAGESYLQCNFSSICFRVTVDRRQFFWELCCLPPLSQKQQVTRKEKRNGLCAISWRDEKRLSELPPRTSPRLLPSTLFFYGSIVTHDQTIHGPLPNERHLPPPSPFFV